MLRYAGGKTRAISQIQPYLPDEPIASAFLGGGSLELAHSKKHKVYANDICEDLINFYHVLHTDCERLQASLRSLLPPNKDTYKAFKLSLAEGTPLERAVKFFYVNRCCFSGCMTGGFSGTRFTASCIEKVSSFNLSSMEFHNLDYEEFLNRYPTLFAYLDPPYDVPNLYRSEPFNHERLATYLKTRNRWILSYNDTPRIRNLYAGYTIVPLKWTYGMARKQGDEILVLNVDA